MGKKEERAAIEKAMAEYQGGIKQLPDERTVNTQTETRFHTRPDQTRVRNMTGHGGNLQKAYKKNAKARADMTNFKTSNMNWKRYLVHKAQRRERLTTL